MKSELVPRIRFGEFGGAWRETSLGNIASDVMYGLNRAAIQFDGENKYIRITDIDDPTGRFIPNPLTSPEKPYSAEYQVVEGDILVARTGASTGKSYIYAVEDGKLYFAGFLIKIHIRNANPYFVYNNFDTANYRKWVGVMSMRSGQPGLNAREYKSFKINLPTLPEQQKIAAFLTAVDGRLAELRRQVAALERYKRGVMQVLMGPEKFKSWEVIKAGDLFRSVSNKNHNGELPILAITQDQGTVYRDDLDKDILTSAKSIQSYKIIDKGDFIISLRSFQGGIEYSDIRGICSPAYTILKPIRPIVDDFYKAYFKKDRFVERLSKTTVGIREGKQISYGAFAALKIPYPPLPEQRRIATFLRALDARIGLVERQLAGAVAFKRGLLQGMFV